MNDLTTLNTSHGTTGIVPLEPSQRIIDNGKSAFSLITILRLITCLFLTFTWTLSPILSTLFIIAYLYFVNVSKYEMIFCFFLLASAPGLVNYTKTPISDLLQYYQTYNELWSHSILQFTEVVKADFLFYFISAVLAKISGGQQQLFVLFWSTATYFTYFLALRLYAVSLPNYNKNVLVGLVFYSLCVGISINLSGHLVRQFFAASLLIYALVLYSLSKKRYIIFFICSVLSHFTALLFMIGFVFGRIKTSKLATVFISLFVCSFIIGNFNLFDLAAPFMGATKSFFLLQEVSEKVLFYTNKMDGEVGLREWVEMAFTTVIACKLYISLKSTPLLRFLSMYFFLIIILLSTRGNNLLLLRYSYYFDFFSGIILLVLFSNYWQYKLIKIAFYALVITAPMRFMRILSGDTWTFINNSSDIIFNTVVNFLVYTPK